MGTKLECAINPFASSQNSNSCKFTLHFLDDYFRTRVVKEENCENIIGLDRNRSSMDNQNMDSIRKTMQMQEDIFKHQVRELHRLYNVQKMLMDEVNREMKNRSWTTTSDINVNINHNFHVQEHHPRERSGSCSASADTMKTTPKALDLEIRLADEDMSAEASAIEEDRILSRTNQMNMEVSDHDSEVELTLSIGGSKPSKKTSNNTKSKPGDGLELGIKDIDSSCSGPNTPISSSSITLDQDTKPPHPHWLFQGLSINRTS